MSHLNGIAVAAPVKAALRGEVASNPQPRGLYEAIARTVLHAPAPTKAIAEMAGLKYAHVTDLANESRHVQLKVIEAIALMRASCDLGIADWMEAQLGRVAFAIPVVPARADVMHRALAERVQEFADFLRINGDALADGLLEPHEVAPLLEQIDAFIGGLCEYRELVKAKAVQDLPLAVTA